MTHESENPTPDDSTPEDWRDRLVDCALREHLGADAPPDLSVRIITAAGSAAATDSPSTPTGDVTMATAAATNSASAYPMGVRSWVLAASVLVNCGLAAALMAPGKNDQSVAMTAEPATSSDIKKAAEEADSNNEDFDSLIDVNVSTVETENPEQGPDEGSSMALGVEPNIVAGNQPEYPQFAEDLTELPLRQNSFEFELRGEQGNGGQGGGHPRPPKAPPVAYPDVESWGELPNGRKKHMPPVPSRASEGPPSPASAEPHFVPENAVGLPGLINNNKDVDGGRILGLGVNGHAGPMSFVDRDFYTPMYRHLADRGRGGQWGFQTDKLTALSGDKWVLGWQGSPDGRGIGPGASGDQYERIHENQFIPAIGGEAVSTFSIDVDTASYANVRQMLNNGQIPPPDAVRLEELVNYIEYDYEAPVSPTPQPSNDTGSPANGRGEEAVPFAAHVETAACPWRSNHRLVRIGIKGREVAAEKRPLSNLVFLVDVSGSMGDPDKLPLVKHGLKQLAQQLGENDRVAIVVYASSEGLALPSTPGTERETILAALDNLQSGGSTAGGAGIQLAYQIAEDNFIKGGTNRVILCTDGDFNVGTTSTADLERMVEKKAKDTKVFLSAIGFGRGNLNDAMMEKITGIGNGNYFYADSQREAERVFVKGMTGMLVTIAKDVKIQVEFNPQQVAGYRLLGYENRMLETKDFNDDKKDAGEIGAGHTVTCLYEIVPAGEPLEPADIDELKYQRPASLTDKADSEELLTLKMRYKQPDEDTSSKLEWPIADSGHSFGQASTDMQFAAAVASFGMLLRDSQFKGDTSYDAVAEIAESAKGEDSQGDRAEFVELVRTAGRLMPKPTEPEPQGEQDSAGETEQTDSTEQDGESGQSGESDKGGESAE